MINLRVYLNPIYFLRMQLNYMYIVSIFVHVINHDLIYIYIYIYIECVHRLEMKIKERKW